MDVIRVGEGAPRAAQTTTRPQTATRKAAKDRVYP
jgi:UDP-N-acetylglucosamine--N-acetylmuramyl-(pentapeptide) pyrophosphoryl-undecaprenol N-acetylglucosamine transferase